MLNKISFGISALLFCVLVAGSSARAQERALTAGYAFAQDLTLGTSGSDVSALQQFLITGGFLKILVPTGYFGPLTRTALGEWQASTGISPSVGFFGPLSRARMNTAGDGSPLHLIIPELNIVAGFQYNGLAPDGTMEIPDNIVDVGWYTGSPRPGGRGNAIITGHVAQIRQSVVTKQGVFYNLSQLRQGDDVYVQNDKGETIRFVVRASRLYDPAADATDVFTSSDDRAHLVIITCEGTWNQEQLSYSQRLVVFADAVQ